jgi:hypothetical protein
MIEPMWLLRIKTEGRGSCYGFFMRGAAIESKIDNQRRFIYKEQGCLVG